MRHNIHTSTIKNLKIQNLLNQYGKIDEGNYTKFELHCMGVMFIVTLYLNVLLAVKSNHKHMNNETETETV